MDILRRLRDAVRRKRPEKCRTNSLFLLRDNAPTHRSVCLRFLSKEQYDNTAASPGLAPADIYLFSRLKSTLKGLRFEDATDIIKNATEELKSIPKNGFQQCFQHFYRC